MNILLYAVFCVVCVVALAQFIRITRYVRDTYPPIWAEFGFAGNGWWVEAADEANDLAAMRRFSRFIRSQGRKDLRDMRLNRMVSIGQALNRVGALLFLIVLATWIASLTGSSRSLG